MRRFSTLCLLSLAAVTAATSFAEAQGRRVRQDDGALILTVRPRSYLEPGNVVAAGSLDRTTSGYAQTQSYLNMPPWQHQGDRFGQGTLPDPVTNGPFVGARSAFGPIGGP
jgi:hypothetical protein